MENECKVDISAHLRAEKDELKHAYEKKAIELEQAEKVIDELKDKIKFMQGQIDAYRDCLNCRR